jgi:hypothetical protein
MKNLTPEHLAEKAKGQTQFCHAVAIGSSVRLCDWDKDIDIDGEVYFGGVPIEFPRTRAGAGGTLKISNVDDAFTSLLINHELNGVSCRMMEVFFDMNFAVLGAEVIFDGIIDGPFLNLTWAMLPLSKSRIEGLSSVPRRRVFPACGFVFKSESCGYTGSDPACSKTRETCRNVARFGGFRFVPSPGRTYVCGKQIYTVK